uniref:MADS-box domain-containing protein n=1 Tax=Kalanchoe fedtschenkoi TaxID=63787 RepID=A0A7N0TP52_KALFE
MGGTGKKKIEIKKIHDSEKRFVTFCKRRKGLFKKVEELGVLTGCRMAAVVFSPAAEKPHACGDMSLLDQYVADSGTDLVQTRPRDDVVVEAALEAHASRDLGEVDDLNELGAMRTELERIRETLVRGLDLG